MCMCVCKVNYFSQIQKASSKKSPVLWWHRHTYVDKFVKITLSQVMENRGIVKVCQVGHIFGFFVFWRIDLLKDVFLEILTLLFFNRRFFLFDSIFEVIEVTYCIFVGLRNFVRKAFFEVRKIFFTHSQHVYARVVLEERCSFFYIYL